jgi:hypothetical protein
LTSPRTLTDNPFCSEMSLVHPALTDSPLLREMLANPMRFGEAIHKSSFAPGQGVREVVPGPRSPPRRHIHLNGAASTSATQSPLQNGTPNSNGYARGTPNEAGPSTPSSLRRPTESLDRRSAGPSSTPVSLKGKSKDVAPPTPTSSKGVTYNAPLYQAVTDLSWPEPMAHYKRPAAGLYNPSMACYANATLQVIMHTPPVLRIAHTHDSSRCTLTSPFYVKPPMEGRLAHILQVCGGTTGASACCAP